MAYSRLGEHGALWFALSVAGAALDSKRAHVYTAAARAVGLAYAANTTIKLLVRRRRPAMHDAPPLVATVTALSYPSAHAATSFAAARKLRKALPSTPLQLAATTMALSRPYLGLHYPTDSLAGAALGVAVAELAR